MNGKPVGDLAWIGALMNAKEGDMSDIAELLENESFVFGMRERKDLADLIAKPKKRGRGSERHRDLRLYREVTSFRLAKGLQRIPDAEKRRIAKAYGLHETETIRSALKNGKRISDMLDEIDAEE